MVQGLDKMRPASVNYTERDVDRQFVAACKLEGWQTIKLTKFGTLRRVGWPDRLVLLGDGQVAFVAIKAAWRRPTALQRKHIDKLQTLGYDVWVVCSPRRIKLCCDSLRARV